MRILRYCVYVILIGVIYALSGCARKATIAPSTSPEQPVAAPSAPPDVQVKISKYRILFPDTGPRIWEAEAASGSANTQNGLVELKGITCRMYEHGKATLQVTADAGTAAMQNTTARVSLHGHVRALAAQRGFTLTAASLRWVSGSGQVTAERLSWSGLGFTHRADRGTFAQDLTRGRFTGNVKTSTNGTPGTSANTH